MLTPAQSAIMIAGVINIGPVEERPAHKGGLSSESEHSITRRKYYGKDRENEYKDSSAGYTIGV